MKIDFVWQCFVKGNRRLTLKLGSHLFLLASSSYV